MSAAPFANDARDQLCMRAAQLSALMHVLVGQGQEHFQSLSDEIQGNILWLVSSLADEIDLISNGGDAGGAQ